MTRQRHGRVLLIGTGPMARATAADLRTESGVELLGAFTLADESPHAELHTRILGRSQELADFIEWNYVDEVYLAGDIGRHHAEMQLVVDVCEKYGIPFAVSAYVFRMQRSMPADRGVARDGFIHFRSQFARRIHEFLKRSLDIVGSAAALVLLSPLLLLTAILVRLDSRGAIMFKQVRVGANGRLFQMLKFRSMVVDAEKLLGELQARNEQDGPVFKIGRDPRITRFGKFIRRYSIDELPQIWNVLVGDMSIVGPRPPVPREVAQYQPWQRRRLSVRPGLTCHWQVQGRNRIGFERWMYLDMQYVDQWSFGTDLGLIAKTLPAVLRGSGAS